MAFPNGYDTRTAYSFIYSMPDFEKIAEKQWICAKLGGKVGTCAGAIGIVLSRGNTFKELVYSKKLFMAIQTSKAALIGGASGALYMGTVQQLSKLRGNKDDCLNHYCGAFGGVALYSILYKQSWRYFIMAGALWGAVATLAKLGGSTDLMKDVYMHRKQVLGHTRYPEMYLFNVTNRDVREGKWDKPN